RVNNHFAVELEKIIERDDLIWVHDYHLIPIADALRRRGHNNRIGFFLHVPFPPPEVLTSLPNHETADPVAHAIRRGGFPDRRRCPELCSLPNFRDAESSDVRVGWPTRYSEGEWSEDSDRQFSGRNRTAGIRATSTA